MAIKAVNQIDVIDLTDGYSVILTNDNYTFLGTTTAVNGTQTTSTKTPYSKDSVVTATLETQLKSVYI